MINAPKSGVRHPSVMVRPFPRIHACIHVHVNEMLPETDSADDGDDDDDNNHNNNGVRDGSSVLKRKRTT